MKTDQLLTTSVHETGHGVVAIFGGYCPLYVTNIPDATSMGRMYWAPGQRVPFSVVHDIATSEERARALVSVAGVAAVRVTLDTNAELAGVDDERARAYGRSTSLGEDEAVRQLLTDAEGIFANEHVRNVTLAIAHRLVRDRVVPGRDIEALIESVGLRRGEATLLRAASGRAQSLTSRHVTRGKAGVLGDLSFVDNTSSRYFFNRERTSR